MPTPRWIAEAFSSHRFDDALPHLAPEAEWTLVGAAVLRGVDAIAEACRETEDDLAGGTATFLRFDVVDGGDAVVVDAEVAYVDATGSTGRVASCDLYRFEGGRVVGIRSYTVEVVGDADAA